MKYTLLDLTQTVLSSMDADEVVSINDTIESEQVVKIIKTCYYELVSATDLPEHRNLFTLTETSVATPTVLVKPATVDELHWFKYNVRTVTDTVDIWKEVHWIEPQLFLSNSHQLDQTATEVDSFTLTGDSFSTTIYIFNDRGPTYWTSFDDINIVCDAYDVGVDTHLLEAKTACFGRLLPDWTESDGFTPDLDDQQFALLLNEAKALAWAEMKQTIHAKAEKKIRQTQIRMERTKQDLPGKDQAWVRSLPNYGRRN